MAPFLEIKLTLHGIEQRQRIAALQVLLPESLQQTGEAAARAVEAGVDDIGAEAGRETGRHGKLGAISPSAFFRRKARRKPVKDKGEKAPALQALRKMTGAFR
jgi:hypothetical protein